MEPLPNIAKIKLKVGSMELEYEGDPSFLTGGIEALLVTMGGLANTVVEDAVTRDRSSAVETEEPRSRGSSFSNGRPSFSTNTIAAHIQAKTGPDLVISAMANLDFVQGKTSCSRSEILAEMKSATTYYTETIRSNLSSTLSNLTKSKRINQVAKDTYALSASERQQLEATIANIR